MHSLTCLGKVCSDDASKNKCLDILCRVMYSVVQAPISTPFFFLVLFLIVAGGSGPSCPLHECLSGG